MTYSLSLIHFFEWQICEQEGSRSVNINHRKKNPCNAKQNQQAGLKRSEKFHTHLQE
jgi:hypothetical protein